MGDIYVVNGGNNPDAVVDIVLIHGLGGHHEDTWTHSKSKVNWVKQYLPQDFPDARILSFCYDSGPVREKIVQSILTLANQLKDGLLVERDEPGLKTRPLVFVSHSLGGLIAKDVVNRSKNGPDRERSIFEATRGFVFFATPHHGSDYKSWATDVTRIFNAFNPRNTLVEELRVDSDACCRIEDNFRHSTERWHFSSFFEQQPMYGSELVVPYGSAVLGLHNEDPHPVRKNHTEICKFESKDDMTYRLLVRDLRTILSVSKRSITTDPPFELSKHYVPPPGLFTNLRTLSGKTKMSPDGRIIPKRFLLYGIGGSGKSQACRKFFDESRSLHRLWIDADGGEVSIEKGYRRIATFAGMTHVSDAIDSVLGWLGSFDSQSESWLLVLDDFPFDAEREPLKYIPQAGNGFVLISARKELSDIDGELNMDEMLRIPGLSESQATGLLLRISGRIETSAEEKRDAGKLVKFLEYLPLAIKVAGAYVRTPIDQNGPGISQYLAEWRQRVFQDNTTRTDISPLYRTFEITISRIGALFKAGPNLAHNQLKLLSFFHHGNIETHLFGQAQQYWQREAEELRFRGGQQIHDGRRTRPLPDDPCNGLLPHNPSPIRILQQYCLVDLKAGSCENRDVQGRTSPISVHSLVAAWARDSMKGDEPIIWFNKAANILAACAAAKVKAADLATHINQLQSEKPDGYSLIHVPCTFSDKPLQIPALLADFYSYTGYYEKAQKLRLAVSKAQRGTDTTAIERWLALGHSYQDLGDHKNAFAWRLKALEAVEKGRGAYPIHLWIDCEMAVAESHRQRQEFATALKYNTKAHGRTEEIRKVNLPTFSPEVRHSTLSDFILPANRNLGLSYLDQEQPLRAIEVLSTATMEAEKWNLDPSDHSLLKCKASLAAAYAACGRHTDALEERRAILKERKLDDGNYPDILIAKEDVAKSLWEIRERDEACGLRSGVFEEWEGLREKGQIRGDHFQLLAARLNFADTLRDMGQRGAAAKHYEAIYESKKEGADNAHAKVCTKACENAFFCTETHKMYHAKEALVALESLVFVCYDMNKREPSSWAWRTCEKAKRVLQLSWEAKRRIIGKKDIHQQSNYWMLESNLALLLPTPQDQIARRTEILKVQVEDFRVEHISTLRTIAALVRNFSRVEDWGSCIKHGKVLDSHKESLRREFEQECDGAMKAYREAIKAVGKLSSFDRLGLDRRSQGVPRVSVSIVGVMGSELPFREHSV